MAAFTSRLAMEPLDRGRRWKLCEPLRYDSDLAGEIVVPAGFECDLNSLPRLAWIVAPKTDYPEAGVVHDWGYRGEMSRDMADAVYREALIALGAGRARAGFRYVALRLFGRFAYDGEPRV